MLHACSESLHEVPQAPVMLVSTASLSLLHAALSLATNSLPHGAFIVAPGKLSITSFCKIVSF